MTNPKEYSTLYMRNSSHCTHIYTERTIYSEESDREERPTVCTRGAGLRSTCSWRSRLERCLRGGDGEEGGSPLPQQKRGRPSWPLPVEAVRSRENHPPERAGLAQEGDGQDFPGRVHQPYCPLPSALIVDKHSVNKQNKMTKNQ